jgi:hypothetical protein
MQTTLSSTSNAQKNQILGQEFATRRNATPVVRPSLTKNAVINAFTGLHFNRDQWARYLVNGPEWLRACSIEKDNSGAPATWNPVLIALALLTKGITIHKLDSVFFEMKDWAKEWKRKSKPYRY